MPRACRWLALGDPLAVSVFFDRNECSGDHLLSVVNIPCPSSRAVAKYHDATRQPSAVTVPEHRAATLHRSAISAWVALLPLAHRSPHAAVFVMLSPFADLFVKQDKLSALCQTCSSQNSPNWSVLWRTSTACRWMWSGPTRRTAS